MSPNIFARDSMESQRREWASVKLLCCTSCCTTCCTTNPQQIEI